MTEIKVGDRVQWTKDGALRTGVIEHFRADHALLRPEMGNRHYIPITHLRPLDANGVVATILARPQDDATRERVIHDLRSAVNDYAFAVGLAGDLGGVEL